MSGLEKRQREKLPRPTDHLAGRVSKCPVISVMCCQVHKEWACFEHCLRNYLSSNCWGKEDQNVSCFQDSDIGGSHAFRSTKPNTSYIFSLSPGCGFFRQAVLYREEGVNACCAVKAIFNCGRWNRNIYYWISSNSSWFIRDPKKKRKEENSFSKCQLYLDCYGCGPVLPASHK